MPHKLGAVRSVAARKMEPIHPTSEPTSTTKLGMISKLPWTYLCPQLRVSHGSSRPCCFLSSLTVNLRSTGGYTILRETVAHGRSEHNRSRLHSEWFVKVSLGVAKWWPWFAAH
eukprot:7388664-Prymnesium_polylepis.2